MTIPRARADGRRESRIGQFLINLVVERPGRRRSPGVAGYLCKKGVGSPDPQDASWIVYREEDFRRAQEIILADAPSTRGQSSAEAQAEPSSPVAASWEEPSAVAVSFLNSDIPVPTGANFIVIGAPEAARLPHQVILLCQNLRVFRRVSHYRWLDEYLRGRATLVVYRGGVGIPGCHVSSSDFVHRSSSAPILALIDLDTIGVGIATRLPRLERICVPSWDFIESRMRPAGYNVVRRNKAAEFSPHEDVSRAWALVREFPRGLSAETFPPQVRPEIT